MIAPDPSPSKFPFKRALTLLVFSGLLTAYCLHLSVISRTAVDIPELDEWGVFLRAPRHLQHGPTLNWLLRRQNEHYIVLPILEGAMFYRLNRWNIAAQQIFNFFIFGLLLALVIYAGRQLRPQAAPAAVSAFALFLLSPLGHRNHAWAIQSHVHFVLMFFILAALAVFSERQRWPVLLLGWIAMTLACFSQAAGVVATTSLLFLYAIFKAARLFDETDMRRRLGEITTGLAVLFGGVVVLGCWFLGFRLGAGASALAWPWYPEFWHFFLDAISSGFGFENPPEFLGVGLFLLVVIPLIGTVVRYRGKPPAPLGTLLAIVIGFLAILASIALGRAVGQPEAGSHSKFFHFAVVLLPFTFLTWHWFLEESKRLSVGVGVALWVLAAVGFSNNLSFEIYYRTQQQRLALEQSILQYYQGVGPVPTEPGLPKNRPVENYLANARKLGVSFTLRLGLPTAPLQGGNWISFAHSSRMVGRCEESEEDGTVSGWAVAPRYPHQTVKLFFTTGGSSDPDRSQRIGETLATLPRRDVNLALGVPGDHGFSVKIRPNLVGSEHILRCWMVDSKDGSEHPLPGGDFLSPPGWPTLPVGFLNGVDAGGAIVGWALDSAHPEKSLRVHFYLDGPSPAQGGVSLGSTTADLLRLDVQRVTTRGANHGFRLQLPAMVWDGETHKIYGFAKSTGGEIFPLNQSGFEFRARSP